MTISAADVNSLRKLTGAGMMDCKEALSKSNGEIEEAIDYLRKKGQKISEKRADRDAKEGVVVAITSDDATKGTIIYLSCETDFVAKNDDFVSFAKSIADIALQNFPSTTEELLSLPLNGNTILEQITEQVGKIGEKIELRRYEKMEGKSIISYVHAGNKIGVLVSLNKENSETITNVGKDLAMQIAAIAPIAVDKGDVDQTIVDRELTIGREQAKEEGKPEEIIEKIATGKLEKFYKENTLLNQPFVKDGNLTVTQMIKEIDQELQVTQFLRVELGS